MIRLSTRNPQTRERLVILVLEPGNLKRMRQDNPVLIELNELVPELPSTVKLMIAYSPEPGKMTERFQADFKIERFEDRRGDEHAETAEEKDFTKPHCANCDRPFQNLGVLTSEDKHTGFFFCPNCGVTFGAQYFGELAKGKSEGRGR